MEKVRWLDENCHVCGNQLNSWDDRISKALVYKHKTCEACIANEYELSVDALREHMEDYFGIRPCQGI